MRIGSDRSAVNSHSGSTPGQPGRTVQENDFYFLLFSKVGDEQELDIKQVVPFILHLEIRAKFSRLWTFSVGKKFLVRVVSADQRKAMEEEESEKVLAEEMIQEMIGVAKVIRHIAQSGKPIIGHNCLLGQ